MTGAKLPSFIVRLTTFVLVPDVVDDEVLLLEDELELDEFVGLELELEDDEPVVELLLLEDELELDEFVDLELELEDDEPVVELLLLEEELELDELVDLVLVLELEELLLVAVPVKSIFIFQVLCAVFSLFLYILIVTT